MKQLEIRIVPHQNGYTYQVLPKDSGKVLEIARIYPTPADAKIAAEDRCDRDMYDEWTAEYTQGPFLDE